MGLGIQRRQRVNEDSLDQIVFKAVDDACAPQITVFFNTARDWCCWEVSVKKKLFVAIFFSLSCF